MLLVEGEDLQFQGQVDLAQGGLGRDRDDGGREVQDRTDPGRQQLVGYGLGGRGRGGDDPDGDLAVAGQGGKVIDVVNLYNRNDILGAGKKMADFKRSQPGKPGGVGAHKSAVKRTGGR